MNTLRRIAGRIVLLIAIVLVVFAVILVFVSGPAKGANFSEPFVIKPPPYTMPVKEKWEDFKPEPAFERPTNYYSLCRVLARDRIAGIPFIVWFGRCNTRDANWRRDFYYAD